MTTHPNTAGLTVTRTPDPDGAPARRRPRGIGRGRPVDVGVEVRFDPRLALAEQLLHRSTDPGEPGRPALLRQVRNLLDDARADQTRPPSDLTADPRTDPEADPTRPPSVALLDLNLLLLTLAGDDPAHRARRIMDARQLLHHVREESGRTRWPDEPRLQRLAGILTALEHPGSASAGGPDRSF